MDCETSSSTPSGVADRNIELLNRFAAFLKWSFMYAQDHERVVDCVGQLRSILQLFDEADGEVTLSLVDAQFQVDDTRIECDLPMVTWLHDALIRAALGGVKIQNNVSPEGLTAFAERFRQNFSTKSYGSHEDRWGEPLFGIHPLELRFAGHHKDSGEEARLRGMDRNIDSVDAVVIGDADLMAKLDEMQTILSECAENDDSSDALSGLDLLETIRKVMPTEALLDPQAALELIRDALTQGIPRVREALTGQTTGRERAMEILSAEVGRGLFTRRTDDVAEASQSTLPEGRPEDESIADDIEGMLAEFEQLPISRETLFLGDPERSREEYAGVLVHQLVATNKDYAIEPIRRQLETVMTRHPKHRQLLQPYIDACLDDINPRVDPELHSWRAVEFAMNVGFSELLPNWNYLTAATVSRNFPNLFVAFLDRLSPQDNISHKELDEVLNTVGVAQMRDATAGLIGVQNIVTKHRLETVLATGHGAMIPLVERALQDPKEWVQKAVVTFLRKRNLPDAESTAVRVVRPFSYLSSEYLLGLANLESGSVQREWLIGESSRLIRNYLTRTSYREDLCKHRSRAAEQLALLPSSENLKLLGQLRFEALATIPSKARRTFRRAAARSFKEMRRRLGK